MGIHIALGKGRQFAVNCGGKLLNWSGSSLDYNLSKEKKSKLKTPLKSVLNKNLKNPNFSIILGLIHLVL